MARSEEETGTQRSENMGQEAMGLGMLGRIQVTPRWIINLCGCTTEVDRILAMGGCEHPPPQTKIKRRSDQGRAG